MTEYWEDQMGLRGNDFDQWWRTSTAMRANQHHDAERHARAAWAEGRRVAVMDLERLARETGLTDPHLGPWMCDYGNAEGSIRAFAAAVHRAALEEAAKACEKVCLEVATSRGAWVGRECAAAIRALIQIAPAE